MLKAVILSAASEPCDNIVFDPSHLAEGIGFPPDEIFAARSNAYGVSFSKRHEADKDLGARTS
ncbi:hypothetical protein BN2476_110256 [Paraburkholderia piptadeniae]|uniref:Uncharacterized protein n=1 Tax=Paraburkholderia piptadeniae TaxID=1701573 RepID=A0A1N7RQF4_9BURK|nr:hypothetical protein [Paraburkholderia piptadeniae]SIT37371.1 hypothetical protein BN2476_110256 [Paraburkholderia piptadeniae]